MYMEAASTLTTNFLESISLAPDYQQVTEFIECSYHSAFGACITSRYPQYLVVTDSNNTIVAATGIRPPAYDYYLEHYLGTSAEQTLSEFYGEHIQRCATVEIGNFAGSGNARAAYLLMHELWRQLSGQGCTHLLLTCTKAIQRRFRHLPLHKLNSAEAAMVPDACIWGSYYSHQPSVMTGHIEKYDYRFSRFSQEQRFQTCLVQP